MQGAKDHAAFIEWLQHHRHSDVTEVLARNRGLLLEIDQFLKLDREQLSQRLSSIDEILASLLCRLEGFSGLVDAISPGADISKQAMEILSLFADSNADYVFLVSRGASNQLAMSDGQGFLVDEPRFLQDDLDALCRRGFVSLEYNSSGNPLFRLTRNGSKFAALHKKETETSST